MEKYPEYTASCADPACVATAFNEEHALYQGWDVVEGALFCPSHRQQAARKALAVAETDRLRRVVSDRRRHRNEEVARRNFSAAEYRAWDEFQSDMADFHKKTGKLAPEVLRTMTPMAWRIEYREKGRIDMEKTADALFELEKKARETRKWLLGRVE
jgi:hypothetical protein